MLDEREEKRKNTISYLLKRLEGKQIGKKSIQKLVYFLQEEFGVGLNYRYRMYHYGPYCSELSNDLDIMDMMEIINISPVMFSPAMYGYSIKLGKYGEEQASDMEQSPPSDKDRFDKLLNIFGGYSAKKLELYATMHMVERILRGREGQDSGKDSVMREVKILKPKYSDDEIENAYNDLLDNSIIGQSN